MNTENNKIIAEFMGWKLGHPDLFELRWSNEWFDSRNKKTTKGCLHFDSDWNWLMEAIEKCLIGEAEHDDEKAKKAISEIYESLCSINISATYKSVVEFIKWHNEQK